MSMSSNLSAEGSSTCIALAIYGGWDYGNDYDDFYIAQVT